MRLFVYALRMVSIGMDTPRPRAGARVSLASLLAERDASIKIVKASPFALAGLQAKRVLAAAGVTGAGLVRLLVALAVTLAAFTFRHGLVLAGLAAFITAAALYSPIAGLVTAGAGAFFLEARRR